jgi:hypothetical protein
MWFWWDIWRVIVINVACLNDFIIHSLEIFEVWKSIFIVRLPFLITVIRVICLVYALPVPLLPGLDKLFNRKIFHVGKKKCPKIPRIYWALFSFAVLFFQGLHCGYGDGVSTYLPLAPCGRRRFEETIRI